MEAIAIGGKGADRRGASGPPGGGSARGIRPPDIRHCPSTRRKLIPPGEFRTLQPAPCRELPFGFARKFLPTPARIGLRILIGDLHHGMGLAVRERALRTFGPAPTCPRDPAPPIADVAQIHRARRLVKDQRARRQHLRRRTGIVGGLQRPLGHRDIAGRLTNSANWRLVTGLGSMKKEPTSTECWGASSG